MRRFMFFFLCFALCVAFSNITRQLEAQVGLIGHWTFNESDGDVAADRSGNGHDGTLEGDPQWTDGGIRGGALEFDGDGDYVQTTLDELQTADNFTISAWFKANVTDTGQYHIMWIGDVAGNGWGSQSELHMTINHFRFSNKLSFYFGSGGELDGTSINIVSLEDFTDTSDWHHIAGVIENANGPTVQGTLYLDGQVVEPFVDGFVNGDGDQFPTTDSADVPERDTWNTEFRIGQAGPAQRWFDGLIDDVRVYDRALSEDEVVQVVSVEPRGKLTTTWAAVKTVR